LPLPSCVLCVCLQVLRAVFKVPALLAERGVVDILHPSRMFLLHDGVRWICRIILSPVAGVVGIDKLSALMELTGEARSACRREEHGAAQRWKGFAPLPVCTAQLSCSSTVAHHAISADRMACFWG
jgi:hypothetical protein